MLQLTSILSSLLLIIFFLLFQKKNNKKKLWVIFFYVVTSFAFDIILKINDFYKLDLGRFYFYSFFTLIEYTFISLFFYLAYVSKNFKRLLTICYPIFAVVFFYSMIYRPNKQFDSFVAPVEAIFIIFFSILYFYEELSILEVTFIYESKNFWIVIAFLIYVSATLFLFVSTPYLTSEEQISFWNINFIANIVKNGLLAIAFSKQPAFKRQAHSLK